MSRNGKILILVFLVCANGALFAYIGLRKSAASTPLTAARNEVERLPAVQVVDDTGRRVDLGGLPGRVRLVQFVNPKINAQIKAVARIVAAFDPGQISFVLITKDTGELRARLPGLPPNVLVARDEGAGLRKTFNIPDCCERRFVFDDKGALKYKDYYYEADLRPRLHLLIDTAPGDFAPALTRALKSIRAGRFTALREETRGSRSGKSLVVLFDSISTTCPSGEMVKSLGRFAAAHEDIPLLVLLPKGYSAADVENLKTNLRVDFPVERADAELAEEWEALLDVYGEGRMAGSVVLIDRGEVSWLTGLEEAEQALSRR